MIRDYGSAIYVVVILSISNIEYSHKAMYKLVQ